MNKFFGKCCKDKITGFIGICTGRTEWMYGCDQYCVTPRISEQKPNELKESQWFDEGRIEIVEDFIDPNDVRVEKNGGEYSHPSCSRR